MTTHTEAPATTRDVDAEPLFLTPEETSEALGMGRDELRELRVKKAGPRHVRLGIKTIRYYRVDVLAYKEVSLLAATG